MVYKDQKSVYSGFNWREAFLGLGGVSIILILILITIGILFIHSASFHPGKKIYLGYAKKQIVWFSVGLIPFSVILFVNYKFLLKYAFFIYIFAIWLLLLTALVGTTRGGSRRWLKLGPFMLQTSEVMKLAVIIMLAKVLTTQQRTNTMTDIFIPLLVVFIPMALIIFQPDLGTSLVFIPIAFVMIFASGIPVKYLLFLILLGIWLAVPVWFFGLHEYNGIGY